MTWQETWSVLRWVLAALVAGFIGQFGKSLALLLLKRRRRKASADAQTGEPDTSMAASSASLEKARHDSLAKIEKKRAKAEVKRLKKS